ncbi:MAG: hypothetical protein WDO73_22720 [Ignavibacteriota bacterium]
MLTYLAEEIEPNPAPRTLVFQEGGLRTTSSSQAACSVSCSENWWSETSRETTYLLTGDVLRKLEVSPAALLTALKDLRKIQHEKKAICQHCGRGPEERRAA